MSLQTVNRHTYVIYTQSPLPSKGNSIQQYDFLDKLTCTHSPAPGKDLFGFTGTQLFAQGITMKEKGGLQTV